LPRQVQVPRLIDLFRCAACRHVCHHSHSRRRMARVVIPAWGFDTRCRRQDPAQVYPRHDGLRVGSLKDEISGSCTRRVVVAQVCPRRLMPSASHGLVRLLLLNTRIEASCVGPGALAVCGVGHAASFPSCVLLGISASAMARMSSCCHSALVTRWRRPIASARHSGDKLRRFPSKARR
jgi:hypothetical protein